jgi:hypothetical protein
MYRLQLVDEDHTIVKELTIGTLFEQECELEDGDLGCDYYVDDLDHKLKVQLKLAEEIAEALHRREIEDL